MECPNCGLKYKDFRTGETFQTVKDSLWVNSDDPNDWKYKRRHTILGRWHMLKIEMWKSHIESCNADEEFDFSVDCACIGEY